MDFIAGITGPPEIRIRLEINGIAITSNYQVNLSWKYDINDAFGPISPNYK